MSYTWEELREEYSNDQFPPFGGPFTDALDPWEWLSKNFDPPKRTEETKIKVTVRKDSEMAKMVDTMKADKQDFKNRVESGEFSGSGKKQTAVDYLIEQFQAPCRGIPSHIIEHANQMFKDHIKESWNDGNLLGRNGNVLLEYNTGEQYYNETYKK